jgi:SET domain-containing protein
VARYINHSCRPNAKPIGRKGRIVIVALRRIDPEEEIIYDYGREYLKFFLDKLRLPSRKLHQKATPQASALRLKAVRKR